MSNFPGPFELRVFYTTNEPVQISSHVLRLSLRVSGSPQPGDPFSSIQVIDKNNNPGSNLSVVLGDLLPLIRAFYVPSVDFIRAELWRYIPSSFDAIFISSLAIGQGGAGTGTTVIAGQLVVTFRTSSGGILKVDLRGTTVSPGVKQAFPFNIGAGNALANYFLTVGCPFIGRDNGVPVSPLFLLPGQNERAWKRVFR